MQTKQIKLQKRVGAEKVAPVADLWSSAPAARRFYAPTLAVVHSTKSHIHVKVMDAKT